MSSATISDKLVRKLLLAFLAILLLAGTCYMAATHYFAQQYHDEVTQKLHANLASDLIGEKFTNLRPIDSTGAVNKEVFGDIMHDMMAVNRAIEVYLLNAEGEVQYSVVLDHEAGDYVAPTVDLDPVNEFLAAGGKEYILGDDPRNPGRKKIFSAAPFESEGQRGFIYIILAGEDYAAAGAGIFGSYASKLALGVFGLTLLFTLLLAFLSVWYLTRNLRKLAVATQRFSQGDLDYRIPEAEKSDLAGISTTFNRMADTIVADMDKIKSLENHRRELIANISHDLRTPLSIIQGYIETLQMKDAELDAAEREVYLNKINTSGIRLSKLVAQLFEYSRLEAKQIEPVMEPFLLSELLNDIHRDYQVLAKKKDVQLALEIPEQDPLVFADISLVERAIQNLMDNAMKFTPDGGVVRMRLKSGKEAVEVCIADSGPGIAPGQEALIFERYRQSKTGKEKEGAGLGLAIVRKIMELHNATIKVLSPPEQGASFSFSLPVFQPA
ncbi:Signal transduction histidine kinase [Robiginitalea myxolifaciens]|uniref:histidine kinase n=1 Tax=Robiginitalea myxolifaciens TaxID=400055 RepID=A0A1I6HGA7_9FLAO|nr:HAMP domain-containing sensor histidine kinase [Robiginitalea myxolifaciens]SFR53287.1 Signal transduction histidine kinase [Robiginitalea myxolifaciens]